MHSQFSSSTSNQALKAFLKRELKSPGKIPSIAQFDRMDSWRTYQGICYYYYYYYSCHLLFSSLFVIVVDDKNNITNFNGGDK
jgi:hypothetical protein